MTDAPRLSSRRQAASPERASPTTTTRLPVRSSMATAMQFRVSNLEFRVPGSASRFHVPGSGFRVEYSLMFGFDQERGIQNSELSPTQLGTWNLAPGTTFELGTWNYLRPNLELGTWNLERLSMSHLSFSVVRERRARMNEMIQNRTMILG